ncbi:hypothetical protein [Fodinicola feengrottensis]|uniref:hypothetical protein n=1 Tax=Fodinicola feengrottensis TaxID=435914 RepID=UPI002442385C|nr:hypothetical protein [Fodinicola feengrottensis]
MVRFGADGKPVRSGQPVAPSRTVDALTLASDVSSQPRGIPLSRIVRPDRLVYGTGSADLAGATRLRTDLRTVFLTGDKRTDRKMVAAGIEVAVPAAGPGGGRLADDQRPARLAAGVGRQGDRAGVRTRRRPAGRGGSGRPRRTVGGRTPR